MVPYSTSWMTRKADVLSQQWLIQLAQLQVHPVRVCAADMTLMAFLKARFIFRFSHSWKGSVGRVEEWETYISSEAVVVREDVRDLARRALLDAGNFFPLTTSCLFQRL